VTELAAVLRIVDTLEAARLRVWLFGGWAEDLRGLRAPCEHIDVDLLYPGRDFSRVDRFVADDAIDPRPHKRSFELEGAPVELLLVQKDEEGWFSDLPRGRHRWPADVFATAGRLPVASVAALESYRHSRRVDRAA
jgi:Aminoglycoside-2''-adenylyltransferase